MMRLPLLVLIVAWLAGCTGPESSCGPEGKDAARMQLLATDVDFARQAAYGALAEAFAGVLIEDAVFLPMNYPALYGRDNIVGFFGGSEPEYITWTPANAEIAGSCDIGYTFGTWQARVAGEGDATTDFSGKYLGAWHRDPERGWRLAVYMQNSTPDATLPGVPPTGDD